MFGDGVVFFGDYVWFGCLYFILCLVVGRGVFLSVRNVGNFGRRELKVFYVEVLGNVFCGFVVGIEVKSLGKG